MDRKTLEDALTAGVQVDDHKKVNLQDYGSTVRISKEWDYDDPAVCVVDRGLAWAHLPKAFYEEMLDAALQQGCFEKSTHAERLYYRAEQRENGNGYDIPGTSGEGEVKVYLHLNADKSAVEKLFFELLALTMDKEADS
jgi:hypothetical protein